MAVEAKRGCGYRKIGGIYLVGGGLAAPCDRLPLPIIPCPTCGAEPRFSRNIAKIDPYNLWGNHSPCAEGVSCFVCWPIQSISGIASLAGCWLMWVGSEYSPESFVAEARELGVSKRIPQIPKGLKVGEDWVYLAYLHLIPPNGQARIPMEGDSRRGWGPGVFYAFRPQRIEKIVTVSMAKDEEAMGKLEEQGVTPVVVPDDDPDHKR